MAKWHIPWPSDQSCWFKRFVTTVLDTDEVHIDVHTHRFLHIYINIIICHNYFNTIRCYDIYILYIYLYKTSKVSILYIYISYTIYIYICIFHYLSSSLLDISILINHISIYYHKYLNHIYYYYYDVDTRFFDIPPWSQWPPSPWWDAKRNTLAPAVLFFFGWWWFNMI